MNILKNPLIKYTIVFLAVFIAVVTWEYYNSYSHTLNSQKIATEKAVLEKASVMISPENFYEQDAEKRRAVFEPLWKTIQSPRIVRIKIWNTNKTIIWSDLSELIDKQFSDNEELAEALNGEVVLENAEEKYEKGTESGTERNFISLDEIYVPFRDNTNKVVGVIEIYQASINDDVNADFARVLLSTTFFSLIIYGLGLAVIKYRYSKINETGK